MHRALTVPVILVHHQLEADTEINSSVLLCAQAQSLFYFIILNTYEICSCEVKRDIFIVLRGCTLQSLNATGTLVVYVYL